MFQLLRIIILMASNFNKVFFYPTSWLSSHQGRWWSRVETPSPRKQVHRSLWFKTSKSWKWQITIWCAPAHNSLIHQIPPFQTYQLFSIYFKCISWTLVFKAIPYFCLLLIPSVKPKMTQNIKVSNMFLKTFFPESPRRVRPTWSLSID